MIVVDASALLEFLLPTTVQAGIGSLLFSPGETLHAPHLLDIEVAHVIRRHTGHGVIDAGRGSLALVDFANLPIRRYPHSALLPRIWALRDNLTAYDAAYVALAEALDAPLLTCDRRLAAATGHRARIELA